MTKYNRWSIQKTDKREAAVMAASQMLGVDGITALLDEMLRRTLEPLPHPTGSGQAGGVGVKYPPTHHPPTKKGAKCH